MSDDRTARERLLDELTQERWAPTLPPAVPSQPRAKQAGEPPPKPVHPGARPTGTGWPA